MKPNVGNHQGFTLIECLVALLIIAVVLASATRAVLSTIEDIKYSYLRQSAAWVAQNQINQYAIDKVYPQIASTQTSVNMAGVPLIAKVKVLATANAYFRRLEVIVVTPDHPNHVLVRLISFVSQS